MAGKRTNNTIGIANNSVSLAGEFAVLSQLALQAYDANMTLGRTKSVDILVSDPASRRMFKLEVKTNYQKSRAKPQVSSVHGKFVSGWIMDRKHERIVDPDLFYCYVKIGRPTNLFKFYIVPSRVVARYVKAEHRLWLREKAKEGKKVKDGELRICRIGLRKEKYALKTPSAETYENNWKFAR
jgi:hypothetical protein